MELSLIEVGNIVQAVGEYERFEGLGISRIQTDSRSIQPGDLFVCITGERFDGHEFAREAVHKGAVAIIVERPLDDLKQDVPLLLVQDSIGALAELAIYCRNSFTGNVVAVTGTAGKTTVKDWLAAALSHSSKVGKNYKNWNNRLGVSLSILGFDGREDYWVLEAGISEENEMDELGMIIRPDVVVVNNVGSAHLQGLGDVTGVAREKMKLLNYMHKQGRLVLNSSYAWLKDYFTGYHDPEIVYYSTRDESCRFYGKSLGAGASTDYKLWLDGGVVQLSGWTNAGFILENLLAAATTAKVLGMDAESIERGLQGANSQRHRWEVEKFGSLTIIDDSYNANPLSMHSALRAAVDIAGNDPVFLLLGDMKELGEYGQDEHEKLGQMIGGLQVHCVFYFGSYAQDVQRGIKSSDIDFIRVYNQKEFLQQWRRINPERGVLLAKGSRGCELDKFVHTLKSEIGK